MRLNKHTRYQAAGLVFLSLTAMLRLAGCGGSDGNQETSIKLTIDISQLSADVQSSITHLKIDVIGDSAAQTAAASAGKRAPQAVKQEANSDQSTELDANFVNSVMVYVYTPTLTEGTLQFNITLYDDDDAVVATLTQNVDIKSNSQVHAAVAFAPSSSGCVTLTVTDNADENAEIRVYDKSAGNTIVLDYKLLKANSQTDTLPASTYTVVAIGKKSGVSLLTTTQATECGGTYSFSVEGNLNQPSPYYTVHVTAPTGTPVWILFDTTVVSNGTPCAAGATITTQLAFGSGPHSLLVYNYPSGDSLIFGSTINPVIGIFDQFYSDATANPALEVHNNLDTDSSPEAVIITAFTGSTPVTLSDSTILPGEVKTFELPGAGNYSIKVTGATSGGVYVNLPSTDFSANGASVININP
jgi:hypothetical protein